MQRMLKYVVAISAAVLSVLPALARAADPETYNIGTLLAMTGGGSYYGTVMSRGEQLAIDEINAKGGIGGKKLKLFIEDHQSGNANASVAGFNRLVSLHGVEAILTSYTPPTLAIAPLADEKKIFLVNGGGVSAAMVGASKYLVHNRALATNLAAAMIARAKEQGFKKMAIVVWKTDAGENVRDAAVKLWKAAGGEVVASESVVPDAANIDTQIAKVKASNPDFIASGVFRPTVGILIKRVREFGMTQPILGIEYTPDDAKVAGKYADGFEFTSDYFQPTEDNPWGQAFYKSYKEKFNQTPDFYAANYYEGVYVIAELIKRAKAKGGDYWNGASLMAALKADPVFKSVYGGTMRFAANGVAAKRVGLFVVKDGKQQFVKYVASE